MDATRYEDLKNLKRIFEDPNKPKYARKRAYRGYQNIQRQMKDKKLTELRRKLVLATRANDREWEEKFTQQIEEYSYRKGYMSSQG